MSGWPLVVLAGGLLVWSVALSFRITDRLLPWVVRRCRGGTWRAVRMTVVLHVGLLLVVLGFCLVAWSVGSGSQVGAGVVVVLGALVAAPVVVLLMPIPSSGFRNLRDDLQRSGATPAEARVVAWTGGPFAIVEFMLLVVGLLATFAP